MGQFDDIKQALNGDTTVLEEQPGPTNFVQKLQQAQSEVQGRKKEASIALAKEKFQKKAELTEPHNYPPPGSEGLPPGAAMADQSQAADTSTFNSEKYKEKAKIAESNKNPNAVNPLSGATGLYQFMPRTWNGLMEKYPDKGLTTDGRRDPAQQEIAMGLLMDENKANLESKNIPVTDGSMHVMHTLGAGDGSKILRAAINGDDRPARELLSTKVVEQNPTWFEGDPTTQELVNRLSGLVGVTPQTEFTTIGPDPVSAPDTSGIAPATAPTDISEDFLGQQDTRRGLQPQPVVEADPTISEQPTRDPAYKKSIKDLEQLQQLQPEKQISTEEIEPYIAPTDLSKDFIGQQDTRSQLETPKAVKPSTPTEIIKAFQVPESPDVAPIEPSDLAVPGGAAAKLVDSKQKKIAIQKASPIEAEIKKTEVSEATLAYGFQGQLHDELTTMGREPTTVPSKPDEDFKPEVGIDRRDLGKDRERAEARQREIAEFKKIDEEIRIQNIEDTSLSEQEQRDLAIKTEARISKKVEEKIKEDPTLEIPKTDPAVYGNPNIPVNLMPDLGTPYSPDYLRELSDALSAVDITAPGLRGLSAPNYMEPTSPAVQTDGRVSAHADGTWSVRVADGSVLPGLDEVTAKSFSAYQAADIRARDLGAPTSTLGNYFNMFMQSWAIPAEMGFSAFTGATTLTQQVDDYNTFRDRSGDTTAITPEEVAQYKAGTLSEEHPNFQALTQLHNQAQVNRKQLQSIHEEAQKYRDAFPVNDADYQGAVAAAEVIQKYKGTGAAIWHSVSNDLGTMMEQGIASIGFMVALTAGGPPMQLAMLTTLAKGRANQAIDEFVTRTGKEPTTEERSRINWSSAAGLVAEKVSAGVLVKVIGKFPGIGGQLAWTKKMKAAVDTNNKSFKNGLLYRGVLAPIGGLAGEAQQGAATSFFEQYAQTGTADIDKIGMAAYYEAVATPGAAGGMIVTSGAYGAGKGVTRKIFGIDKAENKAKLQRGLARIESELAKITKLENINKAIEEQGPLSAAAEKEKDALGGVILFGDLADSEKLGFDPKAAELKKKWEETKAKIAEIEETGKVSGEQFELGFEDTETTLSETAKKQLATLRRQEQVLYAQLLTPVSIEVETKIRTTYRKNLEKALGRNKDLLKEGKFSFRHLEKKYAEFISVDKGEIDPDVGKPIEDSELNNILDEMGVTPKASTLQKLSRVVKRGLTPEQKTKIGKILNKSLKKALDTSESVFSIFGSNFLEGSLDPDNFTDEQLKAEQDKAKTPEDKAAIQKIRDLKALKIRLEKEDTSTIDKDLEEVDTEILEGRSARWKGIDTYRKEILELIAEFKKDNPDPSARDERRLGQRITKIKDLMRNHAENLHSKFIAFQAAQAAYEKLTPQEIEDGKGIIVIGERVENDAGLRTMKYTVSQVALTDTEFQKERKKGLESRKSEERQYLFRIGENSPKLLKALSNEAKFGEAAVSIVEGYQDTSYNTSLEQQKSERLANKELTEELERIKAELSVPTKEASKEDIENVVLKTGETAKKRGETTDANSKKKPGEQLDLFPEGTLPEGKAPVSSKTTKTTSEVTKPLKPTDTGYQPPLPFGKTVKEKVSAVVEKAPTTIQNFIAEVAETYKTVITSKEIKDLKVNLENLLGIVGKKFLDLVDFDVSSPGINTLTDANFKNIESLKTALIELELSEEGAEILSKRYFNQFQKQYEEIIASKSHPALAFRRPLTILMRKYGGLDKLPNQVLFAMMISTMTWSKQNSGSDVTFRSNYDREVFLYGGHGKLKDNDREQLKNLGADYTQTVNRLGKQVQKILRMSKKDLKEKDPDITDAGINLYYQNLGVDLGIVAVQIAATEIKESEKDQDTHMFSIKEHTWKFDRPKEKGRRFNNGPEVYRHIVTNKDALSLTPEETKALDDINEINKSDIDTEDHKPLKDPPSVSDTIKNVLTKIPAKVKFRLKTLQNTPWSKAEAMGVFSKLADNGYTQLLYELAGYQAFDPNTEMTQQVESLKSQNLDKTTAIDEILEADKNGDLEKFYFKYELQNQHRLLMQGRINPQNSKVTRFLLQSWGPTKYNKKNLWMFKVAIAQNLGFKVDKKDYKSSALEFDKITADPIILEAVAALTALDNAKDEKAQKKHAAALAKVLPQIKAKYKVAHGTSILNALTGLSKYKKDGTFESDVVMEIDGISNGWAMNVLQFPMFGTNLERIFNQVGIYFGDSTTHDTDQQDVYETLVEIMEKFEDSATAWAYQLRIQKTDDFKERRSNKKLWYKNDQAKFEQLYKNRNTALTALYPSLRDGDLRDVVKYPFLIYMYGGGIDRIANDVTGDITSGIVEQLGQMQREYNEINDPSPELLKDLEARKIIARSQKEYLKEVVEPFFNHIETFSGFMPDSTKPAVFSKNQFLKIFKGEFNKENIDKLENKEKEILLNSLTEKQRELYNKNELNNIYKLALNTEVMNQGIADVIAPRFDGALKGMLGETKQARDAIVQMGEILHAVFMVHFNKAYEEALKIKDKNGNITGTRSSLTKTEIDNLILDKTTELMKVYPQYVGPLSQIKDSIIEGGIDLTKRENTGKANTPERITSGFNISGKETDVTSNPSKLEFVAPGVSALIRQIINMDSVLLTLTLGKYPQMLALHDAFMGSPAQLVEAAKDYNSNYLKYGMEHSVIQQTFDQVEEVMAIAKSNGLTDAVDKFLFDNARVNKNKDKDSLLSSHDMLYRQTDPDKERPSISEVVGEVKKERDKLEKKIKENGGKIKAYQMYMPTEELADTVKSVTDGIKEKVEDNLETWISKNAKPKKRKAHVIDHQKDGIIVAIAKLGGISRISSDGSKKQHEDFGFGKNHKVLYDEVPTGLGKAFPAFRAASQSDSFGHQIAGFDVDKMREALIEEGYLTDPNNPEEIYDKVKAELLDRNDLQLPIKSRQAAVDNTDFEALYEQFLKENEKDSESFESLDNLPKSDSRTVLESGLTLNTITDLFNKVKEYSVNYYNSKQEMDDHTSVLGDVLGILGGGLTETSNLSFALDQINGITQGTYETKRNHIRVSVARQMPLSINGQSPQEVYTHELVHAMTWQAINDSPLLADNIAALYRQVEADLKTNPEFKGEGWRVFLPKGIGKPSRNDIITAKRQYKYLFDNPKQEARKLHEFLAYAITNKQMINYLKTQPSAIRKDFIGKLLRAIEMVVNTFKRVFGKAVSKESDKNGFEQMLAITEHLVAIQSKHQSKVQQLQSKTYDFLDEADQKIKDFSKLQARKILKSDAKTRIGAVAQGFVGASVHILSENATAQRVRKFATQNLTKTLRGVANEIGGGALSEEMIEQLLHAKVNISKARQEAERSTIQWFNGDNAEGIDSIWKSVDPKDNHSMSVELKEALTDVLFKADLSSLITAGFTHAEIKNFINDNNAINVTQKTIKKKLKQLQSDGFRPSIRYAEELGYHIATGKTKLRAAHMNAHTIAVKYLNTPSQEQISLLDAYTTLEALKHIDSRKSSNVRDLVDNEFIADKTQNGFIDMLDSHLAYKEDSQNALFKDNPTQMVKGYIIERVDNLTSTKVGTAADAEKMKRAGYTESYPLAKFDSNQTYDTLYVSRHMPEVTDVSGVLSTTNQRNMGTTLTEIFMRDPAYEVNGKPDFVLIKQKVKAFIDAENKKSDPGSDTFLQEDDSLKLRPVMDETGRITDYRVLMDHQTTKELLRPDLEIQNVFAHMNSSLIDKQASLANNLETIDILVDEQLDLFESHPKEFTNILDPEGAYIERYYKLPKSVRDRIQSYAIDGKFMVREDIIDKVFGYKSFDISQLKRLDGHPRTKYVAALAHYLVKQVVGYGKDRIVLGMPQVIFSNLFSNISQLSMRKIPLSYIFYKIVEGVSEYSKYRTAHEERGRLRQLKNSKKLSDNSPEAQQIARLTAQIENNKLHKMSEAGLNSLIVEDINDAQTDGYFNRMRRMLRLESFQFKGYTDRIPKKVGTAANWLFLTKSSKPYQMSRHLVQMTDFLGRYVMIEHATKVKGRSFKEAMHEALNAFVLFDEALVPALEAIDAVGATSFLSYFLRNQRASKQLVQASPTSVALSAGVQYTTGIPTLGNVNASWLAGDMSPNMLQFDDLFDEANNATGFEVVAWFQGLFN